MQVVNANTLSNNRQGASRVGNDFVREAAQHDKDTSLLFLNEHKKDAKQNLFNSFPRIGTREPKETSCLRLASHLEPELSNKVEDEVTQVVHSCRCVALADTKFSSVK